MKQVDIRAKLGNIEVKNLGRWAKHPRSVFIVYRVAMTHQWHVSTCHKSQVSEPLAMWLSCKHHVTHPHPSLPSFVTVVREDMSLCCNEYIQKDIIFHVFVSRFPTTYRSYVRNHIGKPFFAWMISLSLIFLIQVRMNSICNTSNVSDCHSGTRRKYNFVFCTTKLKILVCDFSFLHTI